MRGVKWLLPYVCVLLISTSLAYAADVMLTADATAASREGHPGVTPEVYMGLGIEPELDAQTPDQLEAAQNAD
jgi:hypothetical protein